MKILMIMPLFTGLKPVLYERTRPAGMPAMYKLLEGLRGAGHRVDVAVISDKMPDIEGDREIRGRKDFEHLTIWGTDFYIITLPYPKIFVTLIKVKIPTFKLLGVYRMVCEFWKLRKLFRLVKPDLAYIHINYGLASSLIGRLSGVPVILRSYGTGLGTALSPFPRGGWRLAFHSPVSVLTFRAPFEYLVMTNDGTRGDVVSRHYGVPERKLKFWVNGVDKNIYQPDFDREGFLAKLNIPPHKRTILTVSRLAYWKRLDRVIKAAPKVAQEVKEVVFLIVGDGPEYYNLNSLVQSLKAESYIRLIGSVPHDEMPNFMNAADLFVSLYDVSNLCNPVLEAMSCGRCVVSMDDGSLQGIIQHEENGILVKPDSVERDLPEILLGLLRDDSRRSQLGRRAREHALGNLETWEERIMKEIELLEQVALSHKD